MIFFSRPLLFKLQEFLYFFAFCFGCLGIVTPTAANADQSLSLENEYLHLTVKVTPKSAILEEFSSKSQKRNLVVPQSSIPLYQIDLYKGNKPVTLDPSQASSLELRSVDSQTIELKAEYSKYELTARQQIRLKPKSLTASFSMSFKLTKPEYRIGIARMPGIGLELDKEKESSILLPVADGAILENPAKVLKDGEKRSYNYPGLASAQLLAAYDKQGGMVFFAADGGGNFKLLILQRFGKQLILTFENILYHLDPPNINLPYTIEVGAFDDGWERAADIYKLWARNQSWCQKLLINRKMPSDINGNTFTLGLNLREGGMDDKATNRLPEIPGIVKSWSKGLSMPITALLLSWEKLGPWIAPDYFPPYGGDNNFRDLVQSLHQQNQQAMVYLSGYNVTLDKTARHGAAAYKANLPNRKALEEAAIQGADGQILIQGQATEGTGKLATLCPSTSLGKKMVADAFKQIRAYGINRIQLDQVIGGGTPPCFSAKHGHPPVGGNSMVNSTTKLLDSLSHANPEVILSLEEPGELFIPFVHLFHTRDYMEGFWPRDGKGITGVSLFNYLYHEYAIGYGGDSAPISQEGEDPTVALYAQAVNLINGRQPAAAVWMKIIPYEKVNNLQRRFMEEASALWKSDAGVFLRQATLLPLDHQPKLPWRLEGKASGKNFVVNTQKLLYSAYRLNDGRTAIGYINLTGDSLVAELRFASGRILIPNQAKVLWPLNNKKTFNSRDTYKFPPYGIVFLESKIEKISN